MLNRRTQAYRTWFFLIYAATIQHLNYTARDSIKPNLYLVSLTHLWPWNPQTVREWERRKGRGGWGGGGGWAERGDRGGTENDRERWFWAYRKVLRGPRRTRRSRLRFPSIKLIRSCVALTPRCFLDIISSCTWLRNSSSVASFSISSCPRCIEFWAAESHFLELGSLISRSWIKETQQHQNPPKTKPQKQDYKDRKASPPPTPTPQKPPITQNGKPKLKKMII